MPTIMSHAAVPIAGALILGRGRFTVPVIATGIIFSMLPDADVVGFGFGIDYAESWGHRGASHSLLFAAIAALLATALLRPDNYWIAGAFLFLSMASHGLLDTLTNGGLGAALYWPWSDARIFASVTPIEVSPIGIGNFLSARGMAVLQSEALWIWLPMALSVAFAKLTRSRRAHSGA